MCVCEGQRGTKATWEKSSEGDSLFRVPTLDRLTTASQEAQKTLSKIQYAIKIY